MIDIASILKSRERVNRTDFHQMHFDSIQALRGITALFIVLEHVRFLNCGAFGVDIFFCISGFMIMFSTHRDTSFFLRKRLIRILPLYYLMTVGTFLLLMLFPGMFQQTTADPVFLVKSLLFLPFDIGDGVLQPLMRIGWTVNCEIFFYILFMAAMRISHRFRGLLCGVFLAGFTAAAALLPSPPAFLAFYGNPVMLEFLLGIAAYYAARGLYCLYQKGRLPGAQPASGGSAKFSSFGPGSRSASASGSTSASESAPACGFVSGSKPAMACGLEPAAACSSTTGSMSSPICGHAPCVVPILCTGILVLCFAGLLITKPSVNILGFRRPFVWGLPAFAIVMCSFLLGLYVKKIPLPLVRLGNISFSLYLVHYYPVMLLDRAVFDFSAFTPFTLLGVAVAIAVSVLLAIISWAIIEKRFSGWLRSRLTKGTH